METTLDIENGTINEINNVKKNIIDKSESEFNNINNCNSINGFIKKIGK